MMIILDRKPLKTKVYLDVKFANTTLKKLVGLMFEKKQNFNYALVFDMKRKSKRLNSVHMLFVFFDIFVIFLDENDMVVDKTILKPFTINYTPKKECTKFIEMPTKYEDKFQLGDRVLIQDKK